MLPRIVSIMISPAFNVYKVVVNVVGLRYLKYQVSVWYFIPPLLGVTDHEGGGEGEKQESRSGVGHGTPLVSSCLTVSLSHSLMSPGPPHRNLRSCWGRGQKGEGERWEPWDRTNSPHTSHLTPHTSHLTPAATWTPVVSRQCCAPKRQIKNTLFTQFIPWGLRFLGGFLLVTGIYYSGKAGKRFLKRNI